MSKAEIKRMQDDNAEMIRTLKQVINGLAGSASATKSLNAIRACESTLKEVKN